MAGRKSYLYFGGAERISPITSETQFDFDESEVWNSNNEVVSSDQTKRSLMHNSRPLKKPLKKANNNVNQRAIAATSLPMNVPDWSRILGNEYARNHMRSEYGQEDVDEDNDDDGYGRLPPHEYLARKRGSSFSVHEGIGRTLKGRDLSRVRNEVWKQIGYED